MKLKKLVDEYVYVLTNRILYIGILDLVAKDYIVIDQAGTLKNLQDFGDKDAVTEIKDTRQIFIFKSDILAVYRQEE